MFALLLILLLMADIGYGLQCITNCSLGRYQFGQIFNIPDGQCQQRISGSVCSIDITFDYHENWYYVSFDTLMVSADYFYISSIPYLSYSIKYQCSKGTDCVLSYAQNRINEMISRNYNAQTIYGQLAPIIENSSRNGSIQCYNMKNEIVICTSKQSCSVDYDQREHRVVSRGCSENNGPTVFVYDGEGHATFDVECNRDLCNTDETLSKIKIVFNNNGLTDGNGRRIADGNKQMVSSLLMTLTLIFIVAYYF
ncbi:unnamed protein product [Rotaria sp. Silwood2]|nr:unnamed protein product [Rotaria sp. Silwood2]CAF4289575.1 unnamed protein product [Rotaria sp. Silwood2]